MHFKFYEELESNHERKWTATATIGWTTLPLSDDRIHSYCYENGNGVLKIINKSSKNKNNGLVYMINK